MTTQTKFIATLAIAGSMAFLAGCNSLSQMAKLAKDQKLTIEPTPLELHGGEVKFKATALLPVKMFKKDTKYEARMYFANVGAVETKEEFKIAAGSLDFDGNKYTGKSDQPRESKDLSFKYEPKAELGELFVKGYAKKGDKVKETPALPIAKGVLTTSLLYKDILGGTYAGDKGQSGIAYQKNFNLGDGVKQTYVDFVFEKGQAVLKEAEVRDKGSVIDAFVSAKNIPEADGKSTINIKGSHSPEGAETVNTNLANQRTQAMKEYYLKQMKKFNYDKKALDKVKFQITTQTLDDVKPEFFSLLEANTSLTAEQKKEINQIMNGSGDFNSRERQLQEKSYYSTLMDQVYPALRYARTDVFQGNARKSDAEIASLARQIANGQAPADKLSETELLYAASQTPDLEERIKILEAAVKKNDSPVAHNNLGGAQLEFAMKQSDKAKKDQLVASAITHFEIAKKKNDTAEVNYNLAMAYTMQGNTAKADEAINRAIEVGSTDAETQQKLNAVKGVSFIKQAKSFDDKNYTNAENSFSQAGSSHVVFYNKGLAQLLHRDYDKANASFDEALRLAPNDALTYYCKAIVAARKANAAQVAANIKLAVQSDAKLKAKAIKDLEFRDFNNSAEFKDAVR